MNELVLSNVEQHFTCHIKNLLVSPSLSSASSSGFLSKGLSVRGKLTHRGRPPQFSGLRRMEGATFPRKRGPQVPGAISPILSQHCGLTQ